MRLALWELIFMMFVLKLPIVYLCIVVWWAIRAEPRPLEGAARTVAPGQAGPRPWLRGGRRRPRGPHGSPVRTYDRGSASARTRARS